MQQWNIRDRVIATGVLAAALIAAGPVSSQDNPQTSQPDDIVVEGQRDAKRLKGGQWRVAVTRSYPYGRQIGIDNADRPMGKDQSWLFCLSDTQVEPLIRLLIGEGRSASAGGTNCSRLQVALGEGRLKAYQICDGASIYPAAPPVSGNPAPLAARSPVPARDVLTVMGRYDLATLRIEFDSRREPVSGMAGALAGIDGRRWSIKGSRVGECPLKPGDSPAAARGTEAPTRP